MDASFPDVRSQFQNEFHPHECIRSLCGLCDVMHRFVSLLATSWNHFYLTHKKRGVDFGTAEFCSRSDPSMWLNVHVRKSAGWNLPDFVIYVKNTVHCCFSVTWLISRLSVAFVGASWWLWLFLRRAVAPLLLQLKVSDALFKIASGWAWPSTTPHLTNPRWVFFIQSYSPFSEERRLGKNLDSFIKQVKDPTILWCPARSRVAQSWTKSERHYQWRSAYAHWDFCTRVPVWKAVLSLAENSLPVNVYLGSTLRWTRRI